MRKKSDKVGRLLDNSKACSNSVRTSSSKSAARLGSARRAARFGGNASPPLDWTEYTARRASKSYANFLTRTSENGQITLMNIFRYFPWPQQNTKRQFSMFFQIFYWIKWATDQEITGNQTHRHQWNICFEHVEWTSWMLSADKKMEKLQ